MKIFSTIHDSINIFRYRSPTTTKKQDAKIGNIESAFRFPVVKITAKTDFRSSTFFFDFSS